MIRRDVLELKFLGAKAERSKQRSTAGEAERAKREPTAPSTPTRGEGGAGPTERAKDRARRSAHSVKTCPLHTQHNLSQPKVCTPLAVTRGRETERAKT